MKIEEIKTEHKLEYETTLRIIDVILAHEYELSDGFEFYGGVEEWNKIIEEIITILIKAKGETKE